MEEEIKSPKPRKVRKLVAPFTEEEMRQALQNWVAVANDVRYLRAENFFVYLMLVDTGNKPSFFNRSYLFNEWMSLTTILADVAVDHFGKLPDDIKNITDVLYDLSDLKESSPLVSRRSRPVMVGEDHVKLQRFFSKYMELHRQLEECSSQLSHNKKQRMAGRLNDLTRKIRAFQAAYDALQGVQQQQQDE